MENIIGTDEEMQDCIDKYTAEIEKIIGEKNVRLQAGVPQGYSPLTPMTMYCAKDNFNGLNIKIDLPNSKLISQFALVQLRGCCGICISTVSYVQEKYRGKGLGKLLNKFRQDIARLTGYTILLCTDVDSNAPQRAVLKANGWHDIFSFKNKRTNNNVFISVINL